MENERIINKKNKEKARGLLKSYYGIQEKPKIKNVPKNPSDINSLAFDSNQYIKKVKKEYNMKTLLRENNKLSSESKQLDSEMKGLIYDNYRKFINANDSIQNMRKEIDNIDTEMNNLFEKVKNITKTSSEINNSLETSREKIHKLNSINLLLKKLQFILELPARLNHCINQNPPQYSQAVFYYSKTEKLLKKYKDISGFNKIDEECQDIMNEISNKIKINDTTKPMKESSINVGLLIGLHFSPVQLFKEYSSYALIRLKEILAINCIKENLDETNEEQIKRINKLNEEFLNELNIFIISYSNYFLEQNKDILSNILYYAILNDEERMEAEAKLNEIVNELCNEYLNIIDKEIKMSQIKNKTKEKVYIYSLSIFKSSHSQINIYDPLQKVTPLKEKIINITTEWISNFIDDLFNCCIDKLFEKYYNEIDKSYSYNFENLIKESENFLINEFSNAILPKLNNITKKDIKNLDLLSNNGHLIYNNLNRSLKNFWNNIFDRMNKYAEKLSYRSKVSPKLLLYVQFLECLRINTINTIYDIYIQILYKENEENEEINEIETVPTSPTSPTRDSIVNKKKEALSDISSTIIDCQKLIQALLNRYTQVSGNNLIYIAKKSFTEKLQNDDVNKISNFWIAVLKQYEMYCIDINKVIYTNINKQIDTLSVESSPIRSKMIPTQYNNPYLLQNSAVTGSYSSFTNPYINNDQNLMSNIDRLFTERIEYYGNVELNKVNIKTNIINILLKGIIEYIRLFSFTKEDYYQIQLDTEVIKAMLWDFVEDSKIFENILEDIRTSVRVRCSEENLKKENFENKIQNIISSIGIKKF